MQTAHGDLHLEIQTSRKSPVGILRTSFRENGKMKHTQHGRITGCSLEQLKILQLAFRERVVPVDDPQAFKILNSREYGASYTILAIAKQLGLPQALYSRPELWVNSALAMIVGRLVYAGSKLSLCNHHPNTCLWELCGITDPPDVDVQCYEPMDKLLQRQAAIQRNLARRHLNGGHLVLYSIEAVMGRPVGERAQEMAFRVGLAMVLTLMVFATWNDLVQLNVVKFVTGLIS